MTIDTFRFLKKSSITVISKYLFSQIELSKDRKVTQKFKQKLLKKQTKTTQKTNKYLKEMCNRSNFKKIKTKFAIMFKYN